MKMSMKKVMSLVCSLALLLGLMPLQWAAAAEKTDVRVSVSIRGEIPRTVEGNLAADLLVSMEKEAPTVNEVLEQLHEQYYAGGAAGYGIAATEYGTSLTKLWGETDGVGCFYLNGVMPWTNVADTRVKDGDVIELVVYRSDWSDVYTAFQSHDLTCGVGQTVELFLQHDGYDAQGMLYKSPVEGAAILMGAGEGLAKTDYVTDAEGKVSVQFAKQGTYLVSAVSADTNLTAPVLVVTVMEHPVPAFADMREHWAKEAVEFTVGKGYLEGSSETEFSPKENMKREVLVTALWRMAGAPAPAEKDSFQDVEAGACYADAVAWAVEMDITNGVTSDTFGVGRDMQRQELVAFLCRYAEKVAKIQVSAAPLPQTLSDVGAVSAYAKEAMGWAYAAGLMTGRGADTLAPKAAATRGETAKVLMDLAGLCK